MIAHFAERAFRNIPFLLSVLLAVPASVGAGGGGEKQSGPAGGADREQFIDGPRGRIWTCGEYDEAGMATIRRFRDLLPRGSMAVIPRASHLHMLEQPEIFREIVNRFLEETER